MIRNWAIGVVLLGSWVAASATAQWTNIMQTHRSVVQMDAGSIKRQGSIVKAWTREVYSVPYSPAAGLTPMKARTMEFIVNCSTRQFAEGPFSAYNAYGDVLYDTPGMPSTFVDAIPDTIGEKVITVACGK
jgi:hypothetical protein